MKQIAKLASVTLGLTLLLLPPTSAASSQPANSAGTAVFKANCVSCHGEDGRGTMVGKSLQAPDLHSSDVQKLADAQLVQAITQGKGNMPAFGTRLKPDEIDAVVKYVRALGKAK